MRMQGYLAFVVGVCLTAVLSSIVAARRVLDLERILFDSISAVEAHLEKETRCSA